MNLSTFLDGLPDDRRNLFTSRLSELVTMDSILSQFAHNISSESRVTDAVWQQLIDTICDEPLISIKTKITSICQRHAFCGGIIPRPWPKRYGRAINQKAFVQRLMSKRHIVLSTAQRTVSKLVNQPPPEVHRILGTFPLADYPMWATFDPDNPDNDPFETMLTRDATTIRVRLGLSLRDSGEKMVLFVYELPTDIEPHYPTITNAYANPEWHPYFRPAPKGHLHGQTQPLDHPPGEPQIPCPEVVHAPITATSIREPIRQALP